MCFPYFHWVNHDGSICYRSLQVLLGLYEPRKACARKEPYCWKWLWLRRIDRIDKMTIALTNLDSGFKPNRNHYFLYSQMDHSPKFLTAVVASSCAIMSSPSSRGLWKTGGMMTEGDKISPFSFQTRHKYTGVRRSSLRSHCCKRFEANKEANEEKEAKRPNTCPRVPLPV